MPKCERCNRGALPTAEYNIPSKNRKVRLCNNCASITEAARPNEEYLELVEGSEDDGVVAPEERGPEAEAKTTDAHADSANQPDEASESQEAASEASASS